MDKKTLIKQADAIFDKHLTEVDNWNSAIFYTDKQAFLNELIEAITVTHCCKSVKITENQQNIEAITALTEVVKANNKLFGSEKIMEIANSKIKELMQKL